MLVREGECKETVNILGELMVTLETEPGMDLPRGKS